MIQRCTNSKPVLIGNHFNIGQLIYISKNGQNTLKIVGNLARSRVTLFDFRQIQEILYTSVIFAAQFFGITLAYKKDKLCAFVYL